ncbi:MAG TPA: carotenoid oxygenase family protein [Allosphingosinicella sp.]
MATAIIDREARLPIDFETDLPELRIRGELPRDLNGTLYRNGPNPQFEVPGAHWFVGDGMVHAFAFEDGRVRYSNRWVRTAKFVAERDAGRPLLGGFGFAPEGLNSGVANTNILAHGGRLLALEEAHPPIELEAASLATLGPWLADPRLAGPFTAHPKLDPETGELLFFGYNAAGPFTPRISFGVLDSAGRLARLDRFDAPYASMVHDFIVTANHVLFPVLPLTGSLERARRGAAPYAWEPERGGFVGILRRDDPAAAVQWLEVEPCYVFHVMNGWEEGGRIFADVMQYEEPPLFPHADGTRGDPARSIARLCRWTIDPATATIRRDYLDTLAGEFPRIDDRRAGLAYRHGWYASGGVEAGDGRLDGLVHVDHRTGRRTVRLLGEGASVSEPVFVPASPAAGEGEGFLTAVAWKPETGRSELEIYAATDLDSGPLATVEIPHRIPAGFHGNWVAA